MKKDIAKKWVKALRSGKYKQGECYLKQFNDNGQAKHCCLGVLCELYNDSMRKNHKKTLSTKIRSKHSTDCVTFNNKEGELPKVVMKWADIKDPIGRYIIETKNSPLGKIEEIGSLADKNDIGITFKTISNFIEKNVDIL
jgi:hypothetical protein